MMTDNLSQLIDNFFANEKRPIFSIDFLILWLAYGQLITDTVMQTHFKQLCGGFTGDLQLPIKVLNQTGYAIYRAVMNDFP